jgi:acylphosphatase
VNSVSKRIYVSGRVQGVFYRDTCHRVASEQGVRAEPRNLPDGRVEVVLKGDPDAVERVINWCREGPPMAQVSGVEVVDDT